MHWSLSWRPFLTVRMWSCMGEVYMKNEGKREHDGEVKVRVQRAEDS